MPEYDFLHPLNDLLPSGEVCQDWPSAMHDHVSTPLNISAHSYSKSAVKAFHLIFTNHPEATKVTVFSSLSSISIRTPIENGCMCCKEVTFFLFFVSPLWPVHCPQSFVCELRSSMWFMMWSIAWKRLILHRPVLGQMELLPQCSARWAHVHTWATVVNVCVSLWI